MKTYISLLRGVNVGGQNRIGMPELMVLYQSLGMKDVITYIQSGNVVFDCTEKEPDKLIKIIEDGITESFSSDVRVILRDKEGMKNVLENNPFINQRNEDSGKLYVTFVADEMRIEENRNLFATVVPGIQMKSEGIIEPTPAEVSGGSIGVGSGFKAGTIKSKDGDEFIIYDKEIYLYCPNGYGKTKFSNTFFEKKLKVMATTRNWKTVNKLCELAERRQK